MLPILNLALFFLALQFLSIDCFLQKPLCSLERQAFMHQYAAMKKTIPGYFLPDLSQREFPAPPTSGIYDLVCIGSGPGGEAAAVHATQLGALNVAIIEQRSAFGGPTGLTSKAVREAAKRICRAVDQIGGDRRRQVKGLWRRSFPVLKTEAEVLQASESRERLSKNSVDLFIGSAEIQPPPEGSSTHAVVRVCRPSGCVEITAKHLCIATGSRPNRPADLLPGVSIPFEKGRIVCATEMGSLNDLPNSLAIIGGGVIATEYATVFAELGVGVSLICPESEFMPFLEADLRATLKRRMKRSHILFVHEPISNISLEEDCVRVSLQPRVFPVTGTGNGTSPPVQRILPQRKLRVDRVLYSGGRNANSESLNCEALGIRTGKYGRIEVDRDCRTTSPCSIFAVGDVTGAGLASTAQQQARKLCETLFLEGGDAQEERDEDVANDEWSDLDVQVDDDFLSPTDTVVGPESNSLFGGERSSDIPLTLWTIPEIASVGESAATAAKKGGLGSSSHSIVEGVAYFKDCARGRLSGDLDGFLKVVLRAEGTHRHRIIGAHILGDGANELIQLASVLVHSGATAEQVCRTPFAAVTLSGLFQTACDDALLRSPFRARRPHSSSSSSRGDDLPSSSPP